MSIDINIGQRKSSSQPPRLLRIREVMEIVRKKQSAIYGAITTGAFPAPLRLGPRSVAWLERDIFDWIASRPRARSGQQINLRQSWSDAKKRSDFNYELAYATDASSAIRRKAQPLFIWLHQKNAAAHFYKALNKFAPLRPINGLNDAPTLWHSPPPSGSDNRVGLVIAEDATGTVSIFGSNWVRIPCPSNKPVPADVIDQLRQCNNDDDQNNLIADVIDAVAGVDWQKNIDKVEREGRRYRVMPIYLAVVGNSANFFYCTTAIVEDEHQADLSLECVCEVRP